MDVSSTVMEMGVFILCIATQADIGGAAGRGGRYKGLTSLASRGTNAWKAAVMSGTIYGGDGYTRRRRFQRNKAPSFCENFYEADYNDTVYGVFVCPLLAQPDHYSWCCGPEGRQRCCSFFDDAGRTAGVVVGCIMGVFVTMSLIFFCRKHGSAILDIRTHYAAIVSLCSRLFRCNKRNHRYRRREDKYNVSFENEHVGERNGPAIDSRARGITDATNTGADICCTDSKTKAFSLYDKNTEEMYSISNPHAHPEISDTIPDQSLNSDDMFSWAFEADITDSIWTTGARNADADVVVSRRLSTESKPSIKRSLSDLSKSARQHRSLEITTSCTPPPYDVATASNYGQTPEAETEV